LEDAKQRFLAVIEEHQISREESQNSTEEALSTNEELQSLNEELETAKEELQSTNEELITVNDELQANNLALAKARDFAMSIVETVRQPLIVLDMELRIKMANRAFYRLFKVSPQEAEGRLVFRCPTVPGIFRYCARSWRFWCMAASLSRASKRSATFRAWGANSWCSAAAASNISR
jgi:PAS domain-containing protein